MFASYKGEFRRDIYDKCNRDLCKNHSLCILHHADASFIVRSIREKKLPKKMERIKATFFSSIRFLRDRVEEEGVGPAVLNARLQ